MPDTPEQQRQRVRRHAELLEAEVAKRLRRVRSVLFAIGLGSLCAVAISVSLPIDRGVAVLAISITMVVSIIVAATGHRVFSVQHRRAREHLASLKEDELGDLRAEIDRSQTRVAELEAREERAAESQTDARWNSDGERAITEPRQPSTGPRSDR